jgi:hypothetical protein
MKTSLFGSNSLFPLCVAAVLMLGAHPARGASFSVAPDTISSAYQGFVTLQSGALTNGETVLVEEFVDGNASGTIDGVDFLLQSFRVTDGQASVIGGATNINAPFDSNATTGAITAQLNLGSFQVNHLVGQYLFRLSSPTERFAAITNAFTITNAALGQSFTGNIKSSGTNVPFAGVVVMAAPHGIGVGGALANSNGAFTVSLPPGVYQLLAFRSNFVADMSGAPLLTLSNGASINTNLFLTEATRSISGKIWDAANTNTTLPGILLTAESAGGQFAVGFSDANGNYTVRVTAAAWGLGADDSSLSVHGYVGNQNQVMADATAGDATGINVALTKATALFYGSLKDEFNNPVVGASFWSDDSTGNYQSYGWCDANGNYAVPATATNWWVGISSDDPLMANFVATSGTSTLLASNQAVRVDFFARHATHHITGFLKDTGDNPIGNVSLYSNADLGGTNYGASYDTGPDGYFSLPAVNGDWMVGVSCEGGDYSLASAGYCCVENQNVTIFNADGVVNFTATQSGQVAINNSSPLPPAAQDNFYALQFSASGCLPPFKWLLSPGSPSLPSGLSLNTNGWLSGVPTTPGSNNFSIRVTDSGTSTNDKPFLLVITPPPLQVTTVSPLPDGAQGSFYSTGLAASGGYPPYTWSLAPGSLPLPVGLNLATNGTLTGTPTTNGTFNFTIRATDSVLQTADQVLSLTISNNLKDVVVYYVTKLMDSVQTDATTIVPDTAGAPFHAFLGIIQSELGAVPIANVTLPTSSVRGLPWGSSAIELQWREAFPDQSTADATYPPGTYTFGLYAVHEGLMYPTVNMPAAAYPAAPHISNFAPAQALNPTAPFLLQWDAIPGATSNDSLWLVITDTNDSPVFATPYPATNPGGALPGTATSVLIPASTLQLDSTYSGKLTFFRTASVNTTDYPGATGVGIFAAKTSFPLVTLSPVPTLSQPAKISASQFQFVVTGLAGQNYTLQASSNLVDWNSLFVTNAPADVFPLQLNQATNRHDFYRLMLGP